MDAKKTNLTPELKEIYDRVMNTSGGTSAPNTTGALPTTPQPIANPLGAPGNAMPGAVPPPPSPSGGLGATMPSSPIGAGLTPQPPGQMPAPAGEMPPVGTPAEQALTSTPARPLSEGNTFAFNGGNVKTAVPQPQTHGGEVKKKAKISLPILLTLGVVFIVVWGVFWAIILGFIER